MMQISYNETKQKVKGVSELENNDLFEEHRTEGTNKNNAKNKGGSGISANPVGTVEKTMR